MENTQEKLQLASRLIKNKQYERARLILNEMPSDPTAREWLTRLDSLNPQPTTFAEAQIELTEIRQELAVVDQEARENPKIAQRGLQFSTAILIFLGSLFGSLIGAAADFGDAIETAQQIRSNFYPRLCVAGSDTILGEGVGESSAWAELFKNGREVKVFFEAVGSNNGLNLALDGKCVHVLAMSDAMSPTQEQELAEKNIEITCAAEIGYDVIVFITDINNSVRTLEDRALRQILTGSITNWNIISSIYDRPVTIFARPGSGTTSLVLAEIARYSPTGDEPEFPPNANYQACDSNEDCLNKTLNTPGALYWVSAAWMETQPDQYLKILRIAVDEQVTVDPREEDFDIAFYPSSLVRPLYMYVLDGAQTNDQQLVFAKDFLDMIRGVQGQQILEESHFFTHFNRPGRINVPMPTGFSDPSVENRQICKE